MDSDSSAEVEATAYEAPAIARLGTLAELTQGGSTGIDDGIGAGGDGGSL